MARMLSMFGILLSLNVLAMSGPATQPSDLGIGQWKVTLVPDEASRARGATEMVDHLAILRGGCQSANFTSDGCTGKAEFRWAEYQETNAQGGSRNIRMSAKNTDGDELKWEISIRDGVLAGTMVVTGVGTPSTIQEVEAKMDELWQKEFEPRVIAFGDGTNRNEILECFKMVAEEPRFRLVRRGNLLRYTFESHSRRTIEDVENKERSEPLRLP